jgi:hypothetical protein
VVDQSLIWPAGDSAKQDGVTILNINLKILSRFQVKLLPHFTWEDDLAFLRQNGRHSEKILVQKAKPAKREFGRT